MNAQDLAQTCTWATQNLVSFWIPAAVSAIGGMLGGVAEFVTHVKVVGDTFLYDEQETSERGLRTIRRYSALLGWAGAWSMLVVLVATRWWDSEATKSSLALLVLTLAVAGGFGARRLLPRMAERLRQEIDQTRTMVRQVEERAVEAKGVAQAALRNSDRLAVLSRARATFASPGASMSEIFESVAELEELMKKDPLDREILIPLGNLLGKADQTDHAIQQLTAFIEAKAAQGQRDGDYADVLFNRGCFNARRWEALASSDPGASKTSFGFAIQDLGQAFRIKPSNVRDAETDSDLTRLRQTKEYAELLKGVEQPT